MNSTLFFRTASAGAMFASLGLACLAVLPSVASAQQSARLDGYCYVRQADMQRNASVDSSGVKRAYARCYNGTYYAYSGEAYSAPAAPDGYQVAYYSRRPGAEYYSRVVDASTRYESSRSSSTTSTYTGGDRYATTSGYGSTAYGSTAYGDDDRRQGGYVGGADAYDDSRDSAGGYADDRGYRTDDRDYRANGDRDDRSSDYGYDRNDRGQASVQGWRDDSGQWHAGRPRAVGWQDEAGRWHIGSVEAYGWRDAGGQWHEAQEDGNSDDGSRDRY